MPISLICCAIRINDFSFANEFRDNNKCPWAGHIRRTNPRADSTRLGANALDQRRIMRRGIAFGPEVTAEEQTSKTTKKERGLLFACYQANINTAFRFIQTGECSLLYCLRVAYIDDPR